MGWGSDRRAPQPETGVSSRGPWTDDPMTVAADALAELTVEPIISVHGISEHCGVATKHVVPEAIGAIGTVAACGGTPAV